MELTGSEYELLLRLGQALHSSLDLEAALGEAVPLLQELISVDHIALAVSRPGTLYDYEWFNNTLPEKFLGNYARIAEQDFVRAAVASAPNTVLRDHQMITRPKLERHIVYSHSREAGANLEHVMAVMLLHEAEWSSGLSLYRTRRREFSDREAAMLQMIVPQLASAVRNSREHAALQREALLEPAVEQAGVAVIWLSQTLHEITRTRAASAFVERYFEPNERRAGSLPDALLMPLRRYLALRRPGQLPPEASFPRALSKLNARYIALPGAAPWAIVLRSVGIDPALEAKLTPSLLAVAARLVRGMSNAEIAAERDCVVATVKQQASEVFKRLGVDGRKGLIRLASGLGTEVDENAAPGIELDEVR